MNKTSWEIKGIECLGALSDAGAFLDGDGYLLDDFEAEALESGDVHWRVGEQADALDAEVGEDLPAEADGAEDASGAVLRAFAGAQFLMENEAAGFLSNGSGGDGRAFEVEWGGRSVVNSEAARGVVEIENDATARFGDDPHGLVQDFAAMAVGGEDVACGAAGVDSDEDGMRTGGVRGSTEG